MIKNFFLAWMCLLLGTFVFAESDSDSVYSLKSLQKANGKNFDEWMQKIESRMAVDEIAKKKNRKKKR